MPMAARSFVMPTRTNNRNLWSSNSCAITFRNYNLYYPSSSSSTTALASSNKGTKKSTKGFGGGSGGGAVEDTDPTVVNNNDAKESTPEMIVLNAGQKKLANLRANKQAKKDEELRKLNELVSMEKYVRDVDPNAAVIPERVASRMGKRMIPFVGIPLLGGMGSFVTFWYLATYKNLEYQPALVATTTIGLLAIGLLGITYSVMSASWDPDGPEGSVLGFDEFKANVGNLQDGLARSKENFKLRDKMANMSGEELSKALEDLSNRETTTATKKGTSFVEKIKEAE